MDFTLDNDFGKISSFNIDMSDLDISSPCKKDRKAKETSKEESTVAVNKKKGDGFKFSFDFGYVQPLAILYMLLCICLRHELCTTMWYHETTPTWVFLS